MNKPLLVIAITTLLLLPISFSASADDPVVDAWGRSGYGLMYCLENFNTSNMKFFVKLEHHDFFTKKLMYIEDSPITVGPKWSIEVAHHWLHLLHPIEMVYVNISVPTENLYWTWKVLVITQFTIILRGGILN